MSLSLRQRLNELAASFSAGVLEALRSASLEDLLAESSFMGGMGGMAGKSRPKVGLRPVPALSAEVGAAPRRRGGRLPRRSADDIGGLVDRIVELVKGSPEGLRAEAIRQKLGLDAKELPRPLKEGVEAGRLSKLGQKRATTYFAVEGGQAAAPAKVAVRAAARRGRTADAASEASGEGMAASPARRSRGKRAAKRGPARKAAGRASKGVGAGGRARKTRRAKKG